MLMCDGCRVARCVYIATPLPCGKDCQACPGVAEREAWMGDNTNDGGESEATATSTPHHAELDVRTWERTLVCISISRCDKKWWGGEFEVAELQRSITRHIKPIVSLNGL